MNRRILVLSRVFDMLLCLSDQEMVPTGQRPLLKDSWCDNNDYVGGVTC